RRPEPGGPQAAAPASSRERTALLNEEGPRLAATLADGERDAAGAWSAAVTALEERMRETIQRITEVDENAMDGARRRLASLREEAERIEAALSERAEAFQAQLQQRSNEELAREAAALEALQQRIAAFDAQITERQQEHLAHVAGLAERGEALSQRMAELGAEMDKLSSRGRQTQDDLSASAGELASRLAESQALLENSGRQIATLTDESVRLLELIRASAEHSGTDLPQAMSEAERRLAAFEQQAAALRALVHEAAGKGETLAAHIAAAREGGTATLEQLNVLESRLSELALGSEALAAQARGELGEAIATLEEASRNVLTGLHEQQA